MGGTPRRWATWLPAAVARWRERHGQHGAKPRAAPAHACALEAPQAPNVSSGCAVADGSSRPGSRALPLPAIAGEEAAGPIEAQHTCCTAVGNCYPALAESPEPELLLDAGSSPWRVVKANLVAAEALGGGAGAGPRLDGGVPLPELFDLTEATVKWERGAWAFTITGAIGAQSAPNTLRGCPLSLRCRLWQPDCGSGPSPGPSDVVVDNGRTLLIASWERAPEDPTAAVLRMLRNAADAPPPTPAIPIARAPRRTGGIAERDDSAGALPLASAAGGCGCGGCRGKHASRLAFNSAQQSDSGSSDSGFSSSSGSLGSHASSSTCAALLAAAAGRAGPQGAACPVEGLLMGPLLGRGSSGRVYRGIYRGRPAAVKVIDNPSVLSLDAAGNPLEASLPRGLAHPHLAAVLAHGYGAPPAPGASAVSPACSADGICTFAAPLRGARSTAYRLSLGGGGGGGAACGPPQACYIVMEYADGGTLADAIESGFFTDPATGGADLRRVAAIAADAAAGIAHLHSHGLLHADLTGQNVLLRSDDSSPATAAPPAAGARRPPRAVVADFGLCRPIFGAPAAAWPSTPKSSGFGTVTHAAPEVFETGVLTPACDVYSLGVLMWEMLAGRPAWDGLSEAAVVFRVASLRHSLLMPSPAAPTGHADGNESGPAAAAAAAGPLGALVRACLARDPVLRPSAASAAAALAALAAWMEHPEA